MRSANISGNHDIEDENNYHAGCHDECFFGHRAVVKACAVCFPIQVEGSATSNAPFSSVVFRPEPTPALMNVKRTLGSARVRVLRATGRFDGPRDRAAGRLPFGTGRRGGMCCACDGRGLVQSRFRVGGNGFFLALDVCSRADFILVESKPQKHAEVLPTHTPELFQAAARRAAELLRAGEVVALPTETVYGLAANALDAAAVAKIFELKGRPAHNPIIVHVATSEMAARCVSAWPALAQKLAAAFWPGPLTLVLPRAKLIPDVVTAGGPTVGVRWPSHPFIQAVIRECGFPLAAPSANPSNRVSPTNASHVLRHLGHRIPLIVDGGQSQVGIESTVLDISVSPPRILRPGMIHEQAILAVTGRLASGQGASEGLLKSPGLLRKHYSPKARLAVWAWRDEEELQARASRSKVPARGIHVIAHSRIPLGGAFGRVSVIPHDPEAFARAIYAELHQCDEAGAQLIIIEALPEAPEWRALSDRLKRAAAN